VAAPPRTWVVFRVASPAAGDVALGVCDRAEWEAMQRDLPGYYAPVRDGFASEAAAERFARRG
jgi:hypothetical protein